MKTTTLFYLMSTLKDMELSTPLVTISVTLSLSQGCTNPGNLIACATKFFTLVPKIFSIIVAVFPCMQWCVISQAPRRKRQIRERFRGFSRIRGHQQESCFSSSIYRQEFEDDSRYLGKFVHPCLPCSKRSPNV